MIKNGIEALILAGGVGQRLRDVTGQSVPKCLVELKNGLTGLDYVNEQLGRLGLVATISADNYYYQIDKEFRNTEHHMLWQKPGGTVEAIYQPGGTVLIIAPDCIFPYRDIPKMIEFHRPGTITWGVTKHCFFGMEVYGGMDVRSDMAITGRKDKSIIRSPVMIVDNNLLRYFRVPNDRGQEEDFYFSLMPRIEYENAQRVSRGKNSILNAFFFSGPVVDFGTPARLFELRKHFEEIAYGDNK